MNIKTEMVQLKADEGLRLSAYFCPAGKLTIGYGHNLNANPKQNGIWIPHKITEKEAETILKSDIEIVIRELKANLDFFKTSPTEIQNVLINMCYQLGSTKLMKFKDTLHHMECKEYKEAARCMRTSRWAEQTPHRVERLAHRVEKCSG